MRAVRVTLAAGLLAIALAIALALSNSPGEVLSANGAAPEEPLALVRSAAQVCQGDELLPRGTSAIVAWLGASLGPKVSVAVSSGGRIVARGERAAGWTGKSVTIAVRPVARTTKHVTVCFEFVPANESVIPAGQNAAHATSTTLNGKAQRWKFTIEYLGGRSRSWWSRASSITYHMGLGRLPGGAWAPIVAIALALSLIGATSALLVKELR